VRTTQSWFSSFPEVTDLLGMDASSRLWLPGPLSSTMNLFAAVHARWLGATTTGSPDTATHALLTPAALAGAVAHGTSLTGVHVLVAGDRLDAAGHDRALAAGAARVSHYYGAAEVSFVAWGRHADDLRPFPGAEVVSRDGELWVRSPYLCTRYDGPDGPLRRDADGFATVGDRGVVSRGRVLVHGRSDDTVLTAGATVLVTDVERVLRSRIRGDVAAVGVPHPDLGQVLCAVLTDPGDLAAARTVSRSSLDPPHRPRRWFAVDALPLTPAGKLDRSRLADRLVPPFEGVRRLTRPAP
jgi:long-chain acyl-CoA synthetase